MIKRKEEYKIQTISAENDIGNFTFSHIFSEDDRPSDINLMGVITIQQGEECGIHQHVGESDTYYIVSGTGEYEDNEGNRYILNPGDSACAYDGEKHAIKNVGNEPLVLVAVIPFTQK